ncbi:hypothetical protein BD769DRAFT_1364205, partial [Suillus cothurnatus]
DKIVKLVKEANVLYWSRSLLQLTYAFIDGCIASSDEPLPFIIPHVRFVDAGMAISYSQWDPKPTRAGSKTGSTCVGYLVEELIEGSPDAFLKFIHNMDSNPLLDQDDYHYEVVLFFAFTQHVQYVKTGGLAFISDYQGSTELLTDPQILTDLSVGQGKDLFGEGNIECTVSMFEKQHKCNEFCKWPGFGLAPFPMMTEDENTEEAGCVDLEGSEAELEAECRKMLQLPLRIVAGNSCMAFLGFGLYNIRYQYLCCIFGSHQSNNLLAVSEVLEKPLPYIV